MPTQDFSYGSKAVRCLSPVDITSAANAVGSTIDTFNWLGLVVYFATGALNDFVSTVLFEESETSGGVYTTIPDGQLIGIAADVTHAGDDDNQVAQIGIKNTKRWVRLTYVVTTASTENLVAAIAVLFGPQKSVDSSADAPAFN